MTDRGLASAAAGPVRCPRTVLRLPSTAQGVSDRLTLRTWKLTDRSTIPEAPWLTVEMVFRVVPWARAVPGRSSSSSAATLT